MRTLTNTLRTTTHVFQHSGRIDARNNKNNEKQTNTTTYKLTNNVGCNWMREKEKQLLHASLGSDIYPVLCKHNHNLCCCSWFPWGTSTIFWIVCLLCPLFCVLQPFFFFLHTSEWRERAREREREWRKEMDDITIATLHHSLVHEGRLFPPCHRPFPPLAPQPLQLTIKSVRLGPIPEAIFFRCSLLFLFLLCTARTMHQESTLVTK